MPKYFRQSKYKSFLRQLNIWGFQRITTTKHVGSQGGYSHTYLLRGKPSLCDKMIRVKIKGDSSNNSNPTTSSSKNGNSNKGKQTLPSSTFEKDKNSTAKANLIVDDDDRDITTSLSSLLKSQHHFYFGNDEDGDDVISSSTSSSSNGTMMMTTLTNIEDILRPQQQEQQQIKDGDPCMICDFGRRIFHYVEYYHPPSGTSSRKQTLPALK